MASTLVCNDIVKRLPRLSCWMRWDIYRKGIGVNQDLMLKNK